MLFEHYMVLAFLGESFHLRIPNKKAAVRSMSDDKFNISNHNQSYYQPLTLFMNDNSVGIFHPFGIPSVKRRYCFYFPKLLRSHILQYLRPSRGKNNLKCLIFHNILFKF